MVHPILDQHIETQDDIVGGKPRIVGHQITVQNIVIWYEWMKRSAEEIASEYDLTLADVYAALTYYYDHKEEMDSAIHRSQEFVAALRQRSSSKLFRKVHEHQQSQVLYG